MLHESFLTNIEKAYSGTLSRRNFGRLKATLGNFRRLKDVRAKIFYNTDFFHTLTTVR